MVKSREYTSQLPSGTQAIIVACRGPYDFLGKKYFSKIRRKPLRPAARDPGRQDVQLVQGDYTDVVPIAGQQLAGLFAFPPDSGFDPLKPWRLEILVNSDGPPR